MKKSAHYKCTHCGQMCIGVKGKKIIAKCPCCGECSWKEIKLSKNSILILGQIDGKKQNV